MRKTITVINKLKREGIIEDYAIAGGIATIFYVEPILTYDLDIFFTCRTEQKKLISLSPIYNYLKKKGYRVHGEHIVIEGIPVQFIPVYNKLVEAAVENARAIKYKGTKTKILKAEYLIAIMLQTFRPKDRERIVKLLDEAEIDKKYLRDILQKCRLSGKFERFKDLYYKKI